MSPARPLQERAEESTRAASPRPAPLSEAELGALIAAADGRGATALRNRALVALLAASGCKLGEALRLADADVDLDERALRVRARDGRIARTARLLPAAVPHVEAWRLVRARMDRVAEAAAEDAPPFFCTRDGGSLEPSYVRRLLPRLARAAGLGRAVNAGLLRATFAVHVYRLGAPLPEVQRLLGHGDTRSTLHLVRAELAAERREPPRAFRPEQWTLPGTAGTVRVALTLRAEPSARAGDDGAAEAGAPLVDDPRRTVVAPARWPEL